MKRLTMMFACAAYAIGAGAATFTGELFGFWYGDKEDCGLYRYEEAWKSEVTWRSDYVECDGVKEPALFGWDAYAFPVTISPGETFDAEVIHGTSTAKHINSVKVLSDAQMYDKFIDSDEWETSSDPYPYTCYRAMRRLWSNGAKSTRAWIVVEQKNVTSGATYSLDLAKWPIVDEDNGGLSSSWTIASYAKSYGAALSGIRKVTASVWYKVGIKGGEEFPQRVWNVCDPFSKDGRALEKIEDSDANEELVSAPGLFFITPDMIGGGGGSEVSIPEEWQKARTLKGVATRAMKNPVVGIFELKCGKASKKGEAKVSAVLTGLDGKKRQYKARTVSVNGETVSVELDGLSLSIEGDAFSGGEGLPGGLSVKSAGVGGDWTKNTASASVFVDDLSMFEGMVLVDFLPQDEQAIVKSGKWVFAKASGVKWAKPKKGGVLPEFYDKESGKGLIVDVAKDKTNLSGLKLTYTPKKGTFKGSFKVYALNGKGKTTKLKKYTINMSGVVVDGIGYGAAIAKKPFASWPVMVR